MNSSAFKEKVINAGLKHEVCLRGRKLEGRNEFYLSPSDYVLATVHFKKDRQVLLLFMQSEKIF
jgi:hypothetical protein